MDIGIFGLWGLNIPGVTFGGFETVYSEIASRLVNMGHSVTIYSRRECYPPENRPDSYNGVSIKYVETQNTKNLSFLTATTSSVRYAVFHESHDVYLFANVGSGIHCFLAKLLGKRVVLNVDGLDWLRPKWGLWGQTYFKLAARVALFSCDVLLTDSNAMVDYYQREFGRKLDMISYGAFVESSVDAQLLKKLQLMPLDYYLVVTRLIPDNNIHIIVDAFKSLKAERQLVIVGDANYDSDYQRNLRQIQDPRIRFVGRVHDQALLRELYCNCYAYIHGHSVGGTNPALLRALGYGAPVLALNTVFNAEVLEQGRYGILWECSKLDLAGKLQQMENDPELSAALRDLGPQRIKSAYTWEQVAKQYVDLLNAVIQGRSDSRYRMRVLRLCMLTALAVGALALRLRFKR